MKGRLLGQVLSQYNTNCTYQLYKKQLADTVIIVNRYRLLLLHYIRLTAFFPGQPG